MSFTGRLGDDHVRWFGPDEWCAVFVVVSDERGDGGDEFCDGGEASPADRFSGDDGEEDLDEVEPGAPGRREMKSDPFVGRFVQPGSYVRVGVRPVVVYDNV